MDGLDSHDVIFDRKKQVHANSANPMNARTIVLFQVGQIPLIFTMQRMLFDDHLFGLQ